MIPARFDRVDFLHAGTLLLNERTPFHLPKGCVSEKEGQIERCRGLYSLG
jgi:hypothetical protein